MKRRISLILLTNIACLLFVSYTLAQNTVQQQKDSLRRAISINEGEEKLKSYKQLAGLYVGEIRNNESAIDTVLTIYSEMDAEARKQGNTTHQGDARQSRLSALFNSGLYDQFIEEAPGIFKFFEENELWKNYFQMYTALIDIYNRKGERTKALGEAEKLYKKAKAQNNPAQMGMVLFAMSRIYLDERRFTDAEKSLKETIELLRDSTNYLNILATAYTRLGSSLIGQERYDDALQTARDTEEVNRRYEEASKAPRASAWFNLWMLYIDIYRQTKKFDEAQFYLNKLDSATNSSIKLYKERGHIFYGKGQYAEALEMLEKAIETSPRITLDTEGLKLMTLIKMGEADKAYDAFRSVVLKQDSVHNMEYSAQLDTIRTQYEVDKHIAQKERNRNYFLLALGGCILLFILLGVTFYYNLVVTRKNHDLYKRIKEQDRLEEELLQVKALARSTQETAGNLAETVIKLPGDKQQRDLTDRLREYLLHDRNLVNVDISRDDLTSALGTNKNTLSEAVKAVTGKTPMEYIRGIQIEEARRMLDKHPELTIEAIALECGFNALTTFYRIFRKQYGISPAEYRKIAGSYAK